MINFSEKFNLCEKMDGDFGHAGGGAADVEAMSGDFIAADEDQERQDKFAESQENFREKLKGKEAFVAGTIREEGKVEGDEVRNRILDIQEQFDSIMHQSEELSSQAARSFDVDDLSEETGDMLVSAIHDMKRRNNPSLGQKLLGNVPFVGDSLVKKIHNSEKEIARRKSIADIASQHFDNLDDKKEEIKDKLNNIIDVKDKYEQSNDLLRSMASELSDTTLMLENQSGGPDVEDKKSLVLATESQAQIMAQLTEQTAKLQQIDMLENVANIAVQNISQALPSLKSNLTDQLMITGTMETMKTMIQQVRDTQDLNLTMKEQTQVDLENTLDEILDNGLTMSDEQIAREEKLADRTRAFNERFGKKLNDAHQKSRQSIKRMEQVTTKQAVEAQSAFSQIEAASEQSEDKRTLRQRKREAQRK